MAAAGIDNANVTAGHFLLLPEDPDRSAAVVREAVLARRGVNVGVLVTDTAGRHWRDGQTDIAIGVPCRVALEEFAGVTDSYRNALVVNPPAAAEQPDSQS